MQAGRAVYSPGEPTPTAQKSPPSTGSEHYVVQHMRQLETPVAAEDLQELVSQSQAITADIAASTVGGGDEEGEKEATWKLLGRD